MYNRYCYNQYQYNGNKTHLGKRRKTTYITSNIPRQVIENVLPEINVSSVTPIDFVDKLVMELNTALTFDTLIGTAPQNFIIPEITIDDKNKMEKDLRDVMKEFE